MDCPRFPGWSIMSMRQMKSRSAPALSRKMFLHVDHLRELLPSSGMGFRSRRAANWMGFLSILLAIAPVVYVFHADRFPDYALTKSVVLIGGIGGSLACFAGRAKRLPLVVAGASRWRVGLVVACGFSPELLRHCTASTSVIA